jgi:hypothetical protein
MRKVWIAALALAAVIAVAGVAYAANTYDVNVAKTRAASKGSLTKPVPAQFKFGFVVGDTEGKRPFVIRQYRIAAEGLQTYPKSRPRCTFSQATNPNVGDPSELAAACRRAIIGSGTIHNEAGPANDRSSFVTCDVKLTLINISNGDPRYPATVSQIRKNGGMAIRIDQYQVNGVDDPARCPPIDLHEALATPFYDVKIQGVSSLELRFTVPNTLAHPGGLDNALRTTVATILKKTGRSKVKGGATRTVGYFSAVGRKGPTRTVRVTFIDESGQKSTATAQARG